MTPCSPPLLSSFHTLSSCRRLLPACGRGHIGYFFSISGNSQAPPPSVVLYFLTVSVPPFHCLCSRPLVRRAKSSYSQLDPIGLISPTIYLFAFHRLISWGVVHLSPSTKHWLSVYFKPLFTRGKLAEHLSPPPASHATFMRIYSHPRRPHSLLSATEPVIVQSTLRNSWPLLVLWRDYLMNGSLLWSLQYFTLLMRTNMEAISDFIETVVWLQEGIVKMRGTWRRRGPYLPTVPICAGVSLFLTGSPAVLLIGHFSSWSHSLTVMQIKWPFVSFWVGYRSWAHTNDLVLSVSLRLFKPSATSYPKKKK